jgi:hypothetical protein
MASFTCPAFYRLSGDELQYNTFSPIVNSLTPHLKRTYSRYTIVIFSSVKEVRTLRERRHETGPKSG